MVWYSGRVKYLHKKPKILTKKRRLLNRILTLFALVSFAGGVYLLVLVLTPSVPALFPVEEIKVSALSKPNENRIYIPKIGVNVELFEGGAGVLEKGAWHRFPERGDPVAGGNFIVSAHRFSLGATPGQTRQKSPFYHINKLEIGDQIIVDYGKKRYGYEITKHTEVKPTQVEIEEPLSEGEEPRLTIYTCTLKGESDGREVYYAKPLGEVVGDKVTR